MLMILLHICFALLTPVHAGLEEIDHVVLFMQENRAFDHYFGTLAGVRGFKDPNVIKNGDKSVWYQPNGKGGYQLPVYLNEDKSKAEANQCAYFGSNAWDMNHAAWDFGKIDGWATGNSPTAWTYFKRDDLPTHFDIADGWTLADMYAESVIGSTSPNRVTWVSGSINAPGSGLGNPSDVGGTYIDNHESNGCLKDKNGNPYSCYPLKWKTHPEFLEDQGISWFLFQDRNNFDDNPLAWFDQYQHRDKNENLVKKGQSFEGHELQKFYEACANGTLPAVSYIVGPMELSEHPPNMPKDGAWLQKKVIDAVTSSPKYKNTVLIISYDETGGLGDHVPPFVSPKDTEGEWMKDPMNLANDVPTGPGFRVPFYVISPWTKGGHVFTEPADHNSQIKFVEKWVKARFNKDVTNKSMNKWRRENMSDLLNMFDFSKTDTTPPKIHDAESPEMSGDKYTGVGNCNKKYGNVHRPAIPDPSSQSEKKSLVTESGYKFIRGKLTEGRYLAFKKSDSNSCLNASDNGVSFGSCSSNYSSSSNQYIVYQQGDVFSTKFKIKSTNGKYLRGSTDLADEDDADVYDIVFKSGSEYTINIDGASIYGNLNIISVT